MDSELLGRDFINVINELEKLDKLFKKFTNTINLQDREINCINNEIEILSERINTAKEHFEDKNKRQIWLRLRGQKIKAKSRLRKLLIKRACENEEKTALEIKISGLLSEKNRLEGILRQDSNQRFYESNVGSEGQEGSFSEDPGEYKVLINDTAGTEAGFYDNSMESTDPSQDGVPTEAGYYDSPLESTDLNQNAAGTDEREDDIPVNIKSEYPSLHCNIISPPSSTPMSQASACSSCMPQPTQNPVRVKKRKAKEMTQFESSFVELARDPVSRIGEEQPIQRQRDAMDAFFESCAMRARRLSIEQQGWLQMQVSILMYQVETSGTRSRAPSDLRKWLSPCPPAEEEEQTRTNGDTAGQQDPPVLV